MFFVFNKQALTKMIRIVREDRTPQLRGANAPFLRIEAQGEKVSVAGSRVSGTFSATVYEEGVIFLRTTLFRQFLATFHEEQFLTIQVNEQGMHVGDTFLPFDSLEMVLFPKVKQAPRHWPPSMPEREIPRPQEEGNLFDMGKPE